MTANGRWVELRTLTIGHTIFIRHFNARPVGPDGEHGIICTVYALTGGRTPEHFILKPDRGNLFEEHNASYVYLYDSNPSF